MPNGATGDDGRRDGLDDLYSGCSLALLTDLYQLSMACGYWKSGHGEREAVFHLTFRRPPFGGGYAIAAGITPAVSYLERLAFSDEDVDYLATMTDNAGAPLFPPAFLDYLRELRFTCSVDVVPEGSLVFAHEPIVRVRGPIVQAQLVETALLTIVNYQTLIATKASRVAAAARGAPVLEFGLRRAQGIDGGICASRAAYIGGCAATSNVLAGKLFGIPVKGTHAHSWVMFHQDELAAFREYARALPGNCTFLVDTYDTLDGVRHAIEIGHELRARGHELGGIRLDSGDLAHLSIEARRMLDDAGFPQAEIFASNDLDETLIASLFEQGARIDAFGVGTKLVTAYDQPALGGVYKLGAVKEPGGGWRDVIKLSEQPIKISNPGILQVRRLRKGDEFVGDVIYDSERGVAWPVQLHSIDSPAMPPIAPQFDSAFDLLVPAIVDGKRVLPIEPLDVRACPRRRRPRRAVAAEPPRSQPAAVRGRARQANVHDRKLALIAGARKAPPSPEGAVTAPLVFATHGLRRTSAARSPRRPAGSSARSSARRFPTARTTGASSPIRPTATSSSSAARSTTRRRSSSTTTRVGSSPGGAYRLRMVIPFFGYATMERSVRYGEVVTAKTRARLLSSIPMASRGTQVFLLDLHVDSIAHYFEGGIRPIHVYGKHLITTAARRLGGTDFVLACTDAGRAKWVESLANDMNVTPAFVYKRRLDGDSTEVTGVSARVGGKRVVIYDDMIRTGGSLSHAAEAYRAAGATSIDAIATHGLFPGDSLAKIQATGLFGKIVVTDSHPRARALASDFLEVASTAELLVEHLKVNR